jgi:cytochrome d ubiquinol oxidase subunit II
MLMTHDVLAMIWFGLLGVLLAGYAVLDGFDLGVGILHPFIAKNDLERRTFMNAIGPLWDGNEVWLVTFGGAMFAMFPGTYSSVFSGFYNAFMAVLFALILRAVSLEFRSKMQSRFWRGLWDGAFFLGSALATLLFGVAVGNAMIGVPLNPGGDFAGTFLDQLQPYPIMIGLLALALFAMHGSIFLYLKTTGELQERLHHTIWTTFGIFLVMYILATMFTLATIDRATTNFQDYPWMWIVPVLNVLAIANIPRAIYQNRPGYAFVSSSCTIIALVFLLGVALFPYMVVDRAATVTDAANSLTIFNAASSELTLKIGLLFVVIGMPLVLAYTAVIYWTFRGKVELDHTSY